MGHLYSICLPFTATVIEIFIRMEKENSELFHIALSKCHPSFVIISPPFFSFFIVSFYHAFLPCVIHSSLPFLLLFSCCICHSLFLCVFIFLYSICPFSHLTVLPFCSSYSPFFLSFCPAFFLSSVFNTCFLFPSFHLCVPPSLEISAINS